MSACTIHYFAPTVLLKSSSCHAIREIGRAWIEVHIYMGFRSYRPTNPAMNGPDWPYWLVHGGDRTFKLVLRGKSALRRP